MSVMRRFMVRGTVIVQRTCEYCQGAGLTEADAVVERMVEVADDGAVDEYEVADRALAGYLRRSGAEDAQWRKPPQVIDEGLVSPAEVMLAMGVPELFEMASDGEDHA
jgi:hypothetical protein